MKLNIMTCKTVKRQHTACINLHLHYFAPVNQTLESLDHEKSDYSNLMNETCNDIHVKQLLD